MTFKVLRKTEEIWGSLSGQMSTGKEEDPFEGILLTIIPLCIKLSAACIKLVYYFV